MLFKQIRRFFSTLPNLKNFADVKNHKPEGLTRQQAEDLFKTYNLQQWNWGSQHSEVEVRKNDQVTREEKKKQYLKKIYTFKDFGTAFAFMDMAAIVAESMDHHPEWTHYENEVDISLSTHDAGNKVSYKDILLANALDNLSDMAKTMKFRNPLEEKDLDLEGLFKDSTKAKGK